jgi:hypothetical protein
MDRRRFAILFGLLCAAEAVFIVAMTYKVIVGP